MGLPTTRPRRDDAAMGDDESVLPGVDGAATCSPTAGPRSSCASWCSATPASTTSPAGCPASPARCSCAASATSSGPASSSAGRRRPARATSTCSRPAGRDLDKVLMTLGRWSIEWLYAELRPRDIDATTLMWWMHRLVDAGSPADGSRRRRVRAHRAGAHDDLAGHRPWRGVGVPAAPGVRLRRRRDVPDDGAVGHLQWCRRLERARSPRATITARRPAAADAGRCRSGSRGASSPPDDARRRGRALAAGPLTSGPALLPRRYARRPFCW